MVHTRAQAMRKNSKKVVNPGVYKTNVKKNVKFQEDVCNITHYKENNRIVTIAFFYHPQNETVRYGATIFQKEKNNAWNKKQHVDTARGRFKTCPVELVSFSPDKGHFRELLRKQLFEFGVHGNRE